MDDNNNSQNSTIYFFVKTKEINFYSCLFITIFGFVCNSITIVLLLKARNKSYKNVHIELTSAQYYMLAIAISDTLFLLSHFIEDIIPSISTHEAFQFINNYQIVCKLTLYLRNSTRIISSYLGII